MSSGRAHEDEARLVERAKAGDRDAQDELFRLHFPSVHRWLRMRHRDAFAHRESPTDLAQSTFRVALGDLARFDYRGPNSFRNWLLALAEYRLKDRARFHAAQRRDVAREEAIDSIADFCIALSPSPGSEVVAREALEAFDRALGVLSESDQELVIFAKIDGLSHAEIAARRGSNEVAVRKALSRALVRLADRLAIEEERRDAR